MANQEQFLIRIPVDLVVPTSISRPQLAEISKKIEDYAGAVVAHEVLGRVITETQPGSTWHVHNGKTGCAHCGQNQSDRKTADDPRGEN